MRLVNGGKCFREPRALLARDDHSKLSQARTDAHILVCQGAVLVAADGLELSQVSEHLIGTNIRDWSAAEIVPKVAEDLSCGFVAPRTLVASFDGQLEAVGGTFP